MGRTSNRSPTAVAIDRRREAVARPLNLLVVAVLAREECFRVARLRIGREEHDVGLEEEDRLRADANVSETADGGSWEAAGQKVTTHAHASV